MTKINLGDEVRDTVTGFKGIAVGRTEWLTGCARLILQPKVGKDGKMQDSATFDEPTLEIIKSNTKSIAKTDTGGPRPSPMKYGN